MVLGLQSALPVVCFFFQFGVLTTHAEHRHHHVHHQPRAGFLGAMKTRSLQKQLRHAIRDALGNGHGFDGSRMIAMKAKLNPMWQSLAKNANGKLEHRSFLYALQRYMHKNYHVSIVGLELGMNETSDSAAIMSHAPELVRNIVHSNSTSRDGFDLDDLVAMIAMLEQLLRHSGSNLLSHVYERLDMNAHGSLSREQVDKVLESYLLHWLFVDDPEYAEKLQSDEHLREESLQTWPEMAQFMHGLARSFEYEHEQDLRAWQPRSQWTPMSRSFSFADVNSLAGELLLSYGEFWRSECVSVKESLSKLDYQFTGRVKLSDFHAAALDGEWRFGESKDYLRQMGALDESSSQHGPRVIVPNYLQGPSNCIVSDSRYRVCCPNECEDYMAEIEDAVASPIASPEQLLNIVSSITKTADDDRPTMTSRLKSQLNEIAQLHQGQIPLHGRLFAQWLHYVFPQDCPFPHKSGTVVKLSPNEFGAKSFANYAEKRRNSRQEAPITDDSAALNVEDWMTQWSQEEEILTSGFDLKAPWEVRFSVTPRWICVALLGAAAGVLALMSKPGFENKLGFATVSNPFQSKEHFV